MTSTMAEASGRRAASSAPAVRGAAPQASDAVSPHRISARGWSHILRRTGRNVLSDRLMVLSAGISFFAVLSIAPVLVTALSVYGAVNTPEQALEQL
jgi:membrane protein